MKKILLTVCTVSVCSSLMADPVCQTHPGMMHCGEGSINTVDYMGSVDLDGTTVVGAVKILGNLTAQNARLGGLSMRGETHIVRSTIKNSLNMTGNIYTRDSEINSPSSIRGNFYGTSTRLNGVTDITGFLEADTCVFSSAVNLTGEIGVTHSRFLAPVVLKATQMAFSDSSLGNLTVKKTSDNKEQVLRLSHGTTVGNIVFESQKGIVYLDAQSKIQGTVQGGKVVTG